MLLIEAPYRHTKLEIWAPRYSSAYSEYGERVALLAKYKIDNATPITLIEFTKAKHLLGQRYYIHKSIAQSFPVDTNGKIPCYAVPMSALDTWQTEQEFDDESKLG